MIEKPYDKKKLYWLIDQYLLNKISASIFCDEFYVCYNQQLDSDTLTSYEEKIFNELNYIETMFSECEEDLRDHPDIYYNEKQLREKIIEVKQLLGKAWEGKKITLNDFKDYNIPYSWSTLYVGLKLGIFTVQNIMHYAEEYLFNHSDCTDPYVAEFAAGISEDVDVEDLLKDVLKSLKLSLPEKDDPEWNLEKRKLRYCMLKNIIKKLEPVDIFKAVDMVYVDFKCPGDMSELIFLIDVKTYEKLSADNSFALFKVPFDQFLAEEKKLLEKQDPL